MARVDVIIVNYNAGAYLKACIEGLKRQGLSDFRAIIVDNASEDGSIASLGPLDDRFTLIANRENTGFAAACNQGAAVSKSPWIAMLNPDAVPNADWLETLLACAEETGAAALGSTQISTEDRGLLDGAGDVYSPVGVAWRGGFGAPVSSAPPTGVCFGPCAAAALYRRDVFEAMDGFDENFFCYMEDVDLAFRMRLAGHQAVQCREAVVKHVGSAIAGRASPFVVYYGTRNRIWTFLKNTPPLMFAAMLVPHLLVNFAFLVRSFAHQRNGPTWRAIRDALAAWPEVMAWRREVQKTRVVTSAGIGKAMTWSPIKLLRRDPDVRPLPGQSPE
ncbi:glycosyltransferase family 2 protein [Hyphobacterium marinum]|uniref:Glycosyltransferase family 2 protein n=1 Tax=Hyphobacterium marinum TaxID=3116574 RepID=A0ABU7LZ22_9PROT|nr:glycosyltransferase family 2 protein [Hyphobacterium sp. Y6023]MEE2566440.1 glycosyltransferase family 2 protein [Hyphobacterium sp. Y6023]